ncbi:MAG: hypothetical protein LUF68_00655, partial [Clostridiales bacterium]|nr:hypothetical protein [Clostridiales bacterium]
MKIADFSFRVRIMRTYACKRCKRHCEKGHTRLRQKKDKFLEKYRLTNELSPWYSNQALERAGQNPINPGKRSGKVPA